MYPHRIRLRGPWEYRGEESASPRRITMPCRWRDLGVEASTVRVQCQRRFGLPRQLDPYERVWLVFETATAIQSVDLNAHLLARGTATSCEFDVTEFLRDRNLLTLEVSNPGEDAPLWEEVALEIRCQAFLRGLRIVVMPGAEQAILSVRGEVVGEAPPPLDLYVLHENRTILYALVAAGQSFAVESEPLPRDQIKRDAVLRVDLVCGAVIWHTLEVQPTV